MKYIITSLAFAALSLANPVPATADATPPSFKIASIVSGGSGCPQGSIDIDNSNSGILPIEFGNDFTATVGPNVDPDQSRKNCQLNIDLQFSPGYQYTVVSADYSGWGDISSGVKGLAKATYYFSGQQSQASSAIVIPGPFTGKYSKHDDVALSVWSPCGGEGMLNIDAEVALTPMNTAASATMAATKEGVRFTHSVYLKWRQC